MGWFARRWTERRGRGPARVDGASFLLCAMCGADSVVPVGRLPDGDGRMRLSLRCGACGVRRVVTLAGREVGDYERALERGRTVIARNLALLDRARMRRQLEALSIALDRDLIDPGAFAR